MHSPDWTTFNKCYQDTKRIDGYRCVRALHTALYSWPSFASLVLPQHTDQSRMMYVMSHYAQHETWVSCLLPQLANKSSKPNIPNMDDLNDSATYFVTVVARVWNTFFLGNIATYSKVEWTFNWSNHGSHTHFTKMLFFFMSWSTKNCIDGCPEMCCKVCTQGKQMKVGSTKLSVIKKMLQQQ